MAFDAFLKVNGGNVVGESTDSAHPDWIEILGYNWGVTQPGSGSVSSGGSLSAERADFGDFGIDKVIDNASPQFYLACANGTHLNDVTLEVSRSGGDKQKYASFKLTNVIVSNCHVHGAGQGSESLPTESISFRYAKIEWEYYKTDVAGGGAGGVNSAHWDLQANTGG